ncbi:MAG: fibrobacter succinogenes major paralogous domain-containing protein, partial [Prevotellaceae bacterium]|nr:fibrobacter succinogenes major paralogous domain-containing protein [Prevotellaceae bacterium]
IYFRIGLTGPNPNATPRYGLVVLYHSNNSKYYLIYIRQGENAAEIANATGAKYTVYNLKDPANGAGGSTVTDHTDLAAYGGKAVYTAYPSQAGSFFQFGGSIVRAYHPVNPGLNVTLSGWYSYTGAAANECPTGYRRPTYTPNNELIPSENEVSGYYADGFFDRHRITADIGSTTNNSTVKYNQTDVAYFGVLYFNPNTLASVFYPMSGERFQSRLNRPANYGRFWPSTENGNSGYILHFGYENGAYYNSSIDNRQAKSYGFSVRCVQN